MLRRKSIVHHKAVHVSQTVAVEPLDWRVQSHDKPVILECTRWYTEETCSEMLCASSNDVEVAC